MMKMRAMMMMMMMIVVVVVVVVREQGRDRMQSLPPTSIVPAVSATCTGEHKVYRLHAHAIAPTSTTSNISVGFQQCGGF